MVFETALALVLEKVLSKYVENFDRDKLKVGLWGGDVVLRHLKLKATALDDLDLPVKCIYGYLESLVLKIPWKNIYNEPCIAQIDGFYLLAVPNQYMVYHEEQEKKYAREAKQAELEKVELAKLKEMEKGTGQPSNVEQKGFFEKLAANIIKNIQINIKNIHIRYEDRVSNPGKPFSIGVTLDSLDVKSIPIWGDPLSIDPLNLIYKELSIKWLCVYWNSELATKDLYFYNVSSPDHTEIMHGLQKSIGRTDEVPPNFKYLIGPINAQANLRINTKPELDGTNFSVPKILLRLNLEKLYIRLSKRQYHDITCFLNTLDFMNKAAHYRKFRPQVMSVRGHAKDWWHFAYNSVVEDIRIARRNWDWEYIKKHRELLREYFDIYREKLLTPKPSKDLHDKLLELEDSLDLFNILLTRQKVEMEFTQDQLLRLKKGGSISEKKEGGGWISWLGWGKRESQDEEAAKNSVKANFQAALTEEEKGKMFRAIGYSEGEQATIYPEEFVETDLGASIQEINLEFIDEKLTSPTVMTVSFQQSVASVKQWPTIKGLRINVSINELIVHGIEQYHSKPKLVSTITALGSDNPLLQVLFEINPLDKKVDKRVHMFAEPLSIIYDAKTINSLLDVFQTPTEIPTVIQVAAQEKLKEFKEVSSLGLQHMLEVRETIEINVDMKASRVFIPHAGVYVEGKNVIVVTLGNITITTLPRTKYVAKDVAMLSSEDSHKEKIRHSYDNFLLKLSDLQVVYSMDGEQWLSPKPEMYFLKPTSLDINFGKSILEKDPSLPKIKVKAELPIVEISIHEGRLKSCLNLLMSIPLPQKEEVAVPDVTLKVSSFTSLRASKFNLDRELAGQALLKARQMESSEEVIQFYEIDCSFELQDVMLVILTPSDKEGMVEFLKFHLYKLEASLDKYSFNTNIGVKLSSVLLQQLYRKEWIDMILTPVVPDSTDNYLVKVIFTMVEKNSPELHTKYKSTLQLLEVDFTKLELTFVSEALRALKDWVDDFMADFASREPAIEVLAVPSKPLPDSYLDVRGSLGSLSRYPGSHVRPRPTARIEYISLRLIGRLGDISISLVQSKEKFASLGISGGACTMSVKKSYTMFEISLNGIYLNNHTPNTLYQKILSLKDKTEMMKMKVVSFNEADRKVGSVDLSVDLSLARLQFVFLNAFLMSILNFLNHFSEARERIVDASQAAAEAAKQNVKNAYENAIRVGLDIDFKAPLIVVPVNQTSDEAFTLDLGHITANNSFMDVQVPNSSDPAVLDRLKVNLESFKFSRVVFDRSMESYAKEYSIIEPINFKLKIQRNLSSGWFLELPDLEVGGKLHAIKVSLTHPDYYSLMKALAENIGDQGPAPPQRVPKKTTTSIGHKRLDKPSIMSQQSQMQKRRVSELKDPIVRHTLKFALTLESLVVELITTDMSNPEKQESLARITLELISIKGSMMSDESIHIALVLLDCILDDTRSSRINMINRYMERKKDFLDGGGEKMRSMLDITFQQKREARFADIRVSSFVLMMNVEYLQQISGFFAYNTDFSSEKKDIPEIPVAPAKQTLTELKLHSASNTSGVVKDDKMKLTLNFKCEHPDIVLVEHLDDLDTNAIVLDFEMIFSMRTGNEKTLMHGSINELQLFSCAYNPATRKDTKCPILNPLTIILSGSEENGAMKIMVDSTRIKISVTPGTISLLSSIASTVTSGSMSMEEESEALADKSNLWDIKEYNDSDYKFLKTELGVEAYEFSEGDVSAVSETPSKVELCVVKFPEIFIVLESGAGQATIPIIYIDSYLEFTASNWSSRLQMEGKFMLQMKYFNHRHAIWEPLIEPVAVLENMSHGFYNWTLNFLIETHLEEDLDASFQSVDSEFNMKKALMSISVYSPENLNITITKKSLEILQNISTVISDAIYKPEEYKGEKAPYIVKNDSGTVLKIILDGEFMIYPSSDPANKEILLDVDCEVGLSSCTVIEYLGLADETKEKYIEIAIPSYNCQISVPVMKAAKRFFPLNYRSPDSKDQWGIVSDVNVLNSQTVITIRGIIQVENFFNMPVNIYSMMNQENELHLIGTVEPSQKINLPIDAIYTNTSEIFFNVDGYTVSIVPYVWKELQNRVQKTKVLKCNPKGRDQQARGIPLFLRASGELEQVFLENTNRHTILSSCFNISIRPTVIFKNVLPVSVVVCIEGIVEEHTLAPAQSLQVPTAEPGKSFIVVRIPDYLDREWSAKNLIEDSPLDILIWTFSSYETGNVKMELGAHVETLQGTHVYSLYCPFWMVNKTGLRLAYKRSSKPDKEVTTPPEQADEGTSNLLYHPQDFNNIIMFSFKSKSFFAKKKSSLRVEDGPWSDKFTLDTTGTSGLVICKHKNKIYHIGVTISLTYNALSKEVLFTPFHVFVNQLKVPIEVREIGKEIGPWKSIPADECSPFWPTMKPDVGKLQARIEETQETTIPFPYFEDHNSVLKLNNKFGAMNVDIHITDGGVFISFFPYEKGMAPALIINHTQHEIDVCEKNVKENSIILRPNQEALFTWTTFEDNHYLSFYNGKYSGDLREDAIGTFVINSETCYWSSFLYGLQRVFLFTESRSIAAESINLVEYETISQEIDLRVHGVGVSLVDDSRKNEVLYISLSGSDIVWESRKPTKKSWKRFSERDVKFIEAAYQDYTEAHSISLNPSNIIKIERMTLDFKNMKLISPSEKFIRRRYVEGLWVNLKTSPHLTRLHLKVNRLQIDQQIYDCIFPVILAPVAPPKSVMADKTPKPFIELSVLKLTNQYSYVQQYKYIGLLVQEFHVRVDSGLLANLVSLFQESALSEEEQIKRMQSDLERSHNALAYFISNTRGREAKNYYGKLHLSPLKIHFSFSLSGGDNPDDDKSSMPPLMSLILRSFGVTLTDMNDVVFKINYFQVDCVLMTQSDLVKEVQSHYTSQILQQLYVLVFGLDVLGNPFGLLQGFRQGATDLFYEPFQGAIRGPGEFAEGLVLGVRSLVGHTVGGTAGAISKMTGAMGKGLAALTFDDEYQRQRRAAQRQRPANMQEGLARSGKGLVMGVVEGIGGVVTKPISGAKEEGFTGFFKGVGKGMVGLVTRPTAGIVDFASGSLGAVKRATEIREESNRARAPRYIRPDGVVRPFSPREAEGNRYLQQLEKGKYSKTDEYVFHMFIGYASKNKDVLLLTDCRILYLAYNDIFGGYQTEWEHKWLEITRLPEVTNEGVRFWIAKQKTLKSMFGSSDPGKILLVDDPNLRKNLAELIKEYIMKESKGSSTSDYTEAGPSASGGSNANVEILTRKQSK